MGVNLFKRSTLVLALLFALLPLSFPAAAQSGDFSSSAILQLNIADQARIVATRNDLAVAKYKLDYSNYLRNVDLLSASHLPAAPEPQPPTIVLFDADRFAAVFIAFFDRCIGLVGAPCGELDTSSAFTTQTYPPLKPPAQKPVPTQPDNPVCAPMGGDYYGACPGDTLPNGTPYRNPVGILFRKYVIPTPFGVSSWWQVAR